MDGKVLVIIEMALILGGILTFAVWEIRSVRRNKKAD